MIVALPSMMGHLICFVFFILIIGMRLDWIVPRVDMPLHAAVVGQISRRTQKDPRQVHQLTEREIGNEKTDEKEVNKKEGTNPFRNSRVKTEQA